MKKDTGCTEKQDDWKSEEVNCIIKNFTRITGTLLEDLGTFVIISRRNVLRENVSDINCTEIQNTHFMFNIFFFLIHGPMAHTL